MIPLDHDIPLPPPSPRAHRPTIYPFLDAQVGDSFFVPQGDLTKFTLLNRLRALACYYQKVERHVWKVRYVPEALGARCWRIG